jgi:hypothetical protein|nr:MAG TPA: hypothetical protein [Caudoviricetes sp.]
MSNEITLNIGENTERVTMTPKVQDRFYVGAKAKVEQLDNGVRVTTMDKDGTTTATVFNGKNGVDGVNGVGIEHIDFNGYTMNIRLTNGVSVQSVSLRGEKGEIGERGAGIKEVRQNSDYTLTLVFEDGHEFTTGVLRGEKGERGDAGSFDTVLTDTSSNAAQSKAIKSYIDKAISGVAGLSTAIVQTLPTTGKNGVLYLVSNPHEDDNQYDEYLWISNTKKFERIGATSVDLTGYARVDDVEGIFTSVVNTVDLKVDKEDGKGLSSNDFTDAMKDKLNGISRGATNVTRETIYDWGFATLGSVDIDEEVRKLYRRLSNNTLNI